MDIINSDYTAICSRLFEALEESGISQKEFALKLHVSPQTITDWKKGKSSSFTKMGTTISMILNVNPVWLAFGIGEKHLSKEEALKLLKEQISYQVNMVAEAMEEFSKQSPEVAKFSLPALAVAAAYDYADAGTQAAVRKLLDVKFNADTSKESAGTGD